MQRAFLIAVFMFLPALAALADLTESQSLRGIDGVMVVVERFHPDAEEVNLSRAVVELDVRKKLRNADIPMLSTDDRDTNPRQPTLYINCNVMYVAQIELTTFSIDVEVHQRVTLEGGEKAQGQTWAKSYLGVQGKEKAAQKVREIVATHLDLFIADYRQANRSPGEKGIGD